MKTRSSFRNPRCLRCGLPAGLVAFALFGGSMFSTMARSELPASGRLVGQVAAKVGEILAQELQEPLAVTLEHLARAQDAAAAGKNPLVVEALVDPWSGLGKLETAGLALAREDAPLDEALRRHLPALERLRNPDSPEPGEALTFYRPFESGEDPLAYLRAVVESAHDSTESALRNLTEEERAFMISHAKDWARLFEIHLYSADHAWLDRYGISGRATSLFEGMQKELVIRDHRFLDLSRGRLEWRGLLEATGTLSRLGDRAWQDALLRKADGQAPLEENPAGVSGPVLWAEESRAGLILVGGTADNEYRLARSPAAIVDLGGDSLWEGVAAASNVSGPTNAVVVSLGGDDRFHTGNLGLATGVLGVGMLINREGNDLYRAMDGGAGVGIGGIGVILDGGGQDDYQAGRCSLGAGFAGMGIILSGEGDSRSQGNMFTLGFGGPGGLGLVLRKGGNSRYVAGRTTRSGYNPLQRTPDDARFETSGFSMGSGSGRRIFSPNPEEAAYSLAGGIGMLIECAGNDSYEAGNFSLGSGYFFGAGVVLELGGDDTYLAARYGLAAGAHFGASLFVDYRGDDRYASRGPTYNGGCAWDYSVSLFIEGGGDDRYEFTSGNTLGRADHQSWAVAVDLSGDDTYQVRNGMGTAGNGSVAVFVDFDGEDDYRNALPRQTERPDNDTRILRERGLFLDRSKQRGPQ